MRYHIKRNAKIGIPIVLLIGVTVWIATWSAMPHEGTISPPPESRVAKPYTKNKLDGAYISFDYNGKYTARQDVAKNEIIEMYTLYADTRYDKRILASVANLPDGQLQSYGAYIFRQKSPNIYSSRQVAVQGTMVDVWTRLDGTEQTVFVPHNDKVAVISFVTSNTSDQPTGEMDNLLKTFEWKK